MRFYYVCEEISNMNISLSNNTLIHGILQVEKNQSNVHRIQTMDGKEAFKIPIHDKIRINQLKSMWMSVVGMIVQIVSIH